MRFLAELSVMPLPVLLESNTAAKMSNDSKGQRRHGRKRVRSVFCDSRKLGFTSGKPHNQEFGANLKFCKAYRWS